MPVEPERRLAAILSADAVGYSRLMAEDESATVATITQHREQLGMLVRQHRGRVIDFAGDNALAEFPTATDAVACATQIQGVLQVLNTRLRPDQRMEFRIGIHVGEIRVEGERIYGSGVNVAARLERLAEAGGICISSAVHEQVRRAPDLEFRDLGPQDLKNIPDPVHAFHVRRSDAKPRESAAVTVDPGVPCIAVLPFVNMSSDPDQEFFADGMAEELINALTHLEGLRVIARTSAFSFKGTNADIATIGRKLGVATVVEGSVRKAGNRLRITAQLVDVAGGHHLWSDVFDRTLDDVFEIQDEITRTIVRTIKPKLLPDAEAPLVTRPTGSQEAYELYLRAGERIARVDRGDTRTAIEMLNDATTLDPGYADAWARLGSACCQMEVHFDPDARWHEQAEHAVERAFELDPDSPEGLLAHARIRWSPREGFQNHEALRALARSLQVRPGSHDSLLWQSVIKSHVGLLDDARDGLAEALALQPDDAFTLNILAQVLWFSGRAEESQEYYARSLAAEPTLTYNHFFASVVQMYLGDLSAAEASIAKARRYVKDDPLLDANDALLWAMRGETARADEALARAAQPRPSLGHIHHTRHHSATAHALLGRPREAVALLREASLTGFPNYPVFRNDPHLASIQEEPEMQAFLSELERDWLAYHQEFGRRRS